MQLNSSRIKAVVIVGCLASLLGAAACKVGDVPLGSGTGTGGATSSTPPDLDEGMKLSDFNHDQIVAFCDWFTASFDNGHPVPDNSPSQGREIYGYKVCEDLAGTGDWCMPLPSPDGCVANLEATRCTATVEQVVACLLTFENSCDATGQGCDAYLANASCSNTLVDRLVDGGDKPCALIVE